MKLIVITERRGKDWFANCYEDFSPAYPYEGLIGNSGPKRSEPAAASSAIGDFFRRRGEWRSEASH